MTVNVTIDGRAITAPTGSTVFEAAQEAGIDIPALCHHPSLAPIGACRMCLVEIEGQRALQPACTFKLNEGMVVRTESDKVTSVRKFILQLLLSERNHFCMYCQMSDDCTLQQLAYRYGLDSWLYPRPYHPMPVDASRVYFVMDHNRCILCRRCVRACGELVGNHTLGLGERGAKTMIVADMDVPFGESSCISCGTCLEVCPTGALMDRRSAYRGRDVDVEQVSSTCVECSVGCGVELITRDNHVLRVDGNWDAEVNSGLLCVAGRFEPLFDLRKRVQSPMVRRDGALEKVSWDEALDVIAAKLKSVDGSDLAGVASTRLPNEALGSFAQMMQGLNAKSVCTLTPIPEFLAKPEGALASLDGADLYIVVGEDLAADHQVAGMAVRRGVTNHGAVLLVVDDGENGMADLANKQYGLGEVDQAIALAQEAQAPVVIYGAGATGDVLAQLREGIGEKAQFVGLVPGNNARGALAAGLTGACDLNGAKGVFVLAADDIVSESFANQLAAVDFLVVQASYAGVLSEQADVVLPSAVWAERSGTIINTEGRSLPVVAGIEAPAGVKSDQEILEALAARLA